MEYLGNTSSNISKIARVSKASSKASTIPTGKLPIIGQESPKKEKIESKTMYHHRGRGASEPRLRYPNHPINAYGTES